MSRSHDSKAVPPVADLVVVGSFNQDHIWRSSKFPQPGETRMGRFSCGPGGKGFNQAVAAARQGAKTCFIGAIGTDALGDAAAALALAEGITARWQRVPSEATGTAVILLDGSGQNMIVVAPGANTTLSPAHVTAQSKAIASARVLVTQHEVHAASSRRAMEIARAAGVTCLHNPAPVLEASAASALLSLADVLTPNETEFAALLAHLDQGVAANDLAGLDDAALHSLCQRLPSPTVVLTLGAVGVFVSHRSDITRGDASSCYRVAAEKVSVIDTTGAGDAFSGALAAALALAPELPFVEAVRQANRVAGMAVEQAGAALAMPRAEDVKKRFS